MRADKGNRKDRDLAKVLREPEAGTYLLLSPLNQARVQKEEVLRNKRRNTAFSVEKLRENSTKGTDRHKVKLE